MKINNLAIKNFKKYADLTIDLHPQFTLLVGENGSGKTTILDALAVAMGIWLVEPPDPTLMNSRRKIEQNEIRLTPTLEGDRLQFHRYLPVVVSATGEINGQLGKMWTRQIKEKGIKTTNSDAEEVLGLIENIYKRFTASEKVFCPIR